MVTCGGTTAAVQRRKSVEEVRILTFSTAFLSWTAVSAADTKCLLILERSYYLHSLNQYGSKIHNEYGNILTTIQLVKNQEVVFENSGPPSEKLSQGQKTGASGFGITNATLSLSFFTGRSDENQRVHDVVHREKLNGHFGFISVLS
ncbi:unnamed protein product, partial [Nesidiocoris tenuis]